MGVQRSRIAAFIKSHPLLVITMPILALALGGVLAAVAVKGAPNAPVEKATALTLTIPQAVPSGASGNVALDFLGLAYEESSFIRYVTD